MRELSKRVVACSALGDYQQPLAAIKHLVSIEPLAQALVALPTFLPDLKHNTGRAIQLPGSSWLGPCFSVSVIPDPLIFAQPSIREQCFDNVQNRRQVSSSTSVLPIDFVHAQTRCGVWCT